MPCTDQKRTWLMKNNIKVDFDYITDSGDGSLNKNRYDIHWSNKITREIEIISWNWKFI